MIGSPIRRSSSGRSPLPQGSRVTVALTPRSLVRAPIAAEAVSYGLGRPAEGSAGVGQFGTGLLRSDPHRHSSRMTPRRVWASADLLGQPDENALSWFPTSRHGFPMAGTSPS
jgi:hypothetical protein